MKRFQEVSDVEPEQHYTFADFMDEPAEFQPEGSSYRERVAVLERKVGELETVVAALRADAKSIDDFLRARIGHLVGEFVERCREAIPPTVEIQEAVHEKFEAEGQELAKAIYAAILKKLR